MGSQEFVRNDEIPGQGKQVLVLAKKLKLTNVELDRIFHEFCKHRDIESKTVDLEALFRALKCPYTLFARLMFQFFDANKTGKLVFFEYMIIMWGVLSTDEDGLAALLFSLFDTERYMTSRL